MSLKKSGKLVEGDMTKTLYIKKGVWYSATCNGYCDECVVRFRCYTTKDKGLEVTEEESISCREKNGGVILL